MNNKYSSNTSQTDWARIDAMTDEDIDFSDIPRTTPEFWANGIVRKGLKPVVRKRQVTIRLDSDIIDYLRSNGEGYQTRINQLLRSFVDADKAAHAK